jgi:hypothetical protein
MSQQNYVIPATMCYGPPQLSYVPGRGIDSRLIAVGARNTFFIIFFEAMDNKIAPKIETTLFLRLILITLYVPILYCRMLESHTNY